MPGCVLEENSGQAVYMRDTQTKLCTLGILRKGCTLDRYSSEVVHLRDTQYGYVLEGYSSNVIYLLVAWAEQPKS